MPENLSEARGIQNAQVRHANRSEARLTSSRIYENAGRQHRKKGSSHENRQTRSGRQNIEVNQVNTLASILKKLPSESDIPYGDEDAKLLLKDKPHEPGFPYIILAIAIFKDILDVPGELSLVGIVITTALSFVLALVLFFWLLGKMSGGWWKKRMIRWLWARYVIAMAIELLPFGKIIPATTILVLMAHYRETKIVKLLNRALEELRKKNLPGFQ